ncbi:hypothetical protein PBI_SCTP2_54 [Salicola phage SCTP-2]|nr:hypothetical protein PBI_SCTP2_54 [Salicola phage SCTP-2]
MTTIIVDLKHNKTEFGFFKPFGFRKTQIKTHGNVKIIPNDHNSVFVGAGYTDVIKRFIQNYKKGKLSKLPDSCVLLIENCYPTFKLKAFEGKNCDRVKIHDETRHIIIGSGSHYASGYMDGCDPEDEHRAYKAIQTASKFDFYTNNYIIVYSFPNYNDIC